MTTFKAALGLCGLSQREAATFFGVSEQSVKNWSRDAAPPPIGVWRELAGLLARIESAADYAAGMVEPELMDRRAMNNVQADDGADPLPGSGADTAGALALLMAIRDAD